MLLWVFCWSTSGLFIQFIDWHPLVISGVRSGIAALFMLLVSGGKVLKRPDARDGARGALLLLAAAGTSAGTKILYVLANKLTTPANAIVLHHSAPIWAAFLGWALIGERPRKNQWAALPFVCLGIFLLFINGLRYGSRDGDSIVGDAVALAAGICFAASMVFLRMNRAASPALCLFLSHCIPFVIGLPFIIRSPPVFTAKSVAAIIFLGIVQVGAASLLYAHAIKRIRAIDAVLISQLEPVLNPLWIFLATGAIPAPLSIAGGVIIILAVLAGQKHGTRRPLAQIESTS
jgi:drug/metabolite transporter (DMT)-like permease